MKHIIILSILLISLTGCYAVQDITQQELTPADIERLKQVERNMLEGDAEEIQIDTEILEAVRQMEATLKPEYRRHLLAKYKLGFLEISDIDRKYVSKMHNYITEKTLTFSFLQPVIARNFNIVERFLLKDVLRELHLEQYQSPYGQHYIDQYLAKELGKLYPIDVIETGVVTVSRNYIDINLRMIETRRGRIVAVGASKIPRTKIVNQWLDDMDAVGVGWPGYY